MDFSRVLNQSFLENAPKTQDSTKELLDQGKNFMKTMSGERGIMAAIESAHLRPKIASFIKGKLNSVSSDDVLKTAKNMSTRMGGRIEPTAREPGVGGTVSAGPRGELAASGVSSSVARENLVMAPKPSDTGLVQEGGFQSLASGRSIGDRFGTSTATIESSRLTSGIDATNNPLSPSNINNVGQSSAVPKLDTPEELPGLSGASAVTPRALAQSDNIATPEALTARAGARAVAATQAKFQEDIPSLPSAKPAPIVKVLPTKEETEAAGAGTRAGATGTRANELVRATPKPTPAPSVPSASTPAPEIGPLGSANNPYMPDQAPTPTIKPEDFPTPPPAARGETDEAMASRLAREGEGVESSIGSVVRTGIGAAGTSLEVAGVAEALGQRGLTGNQRAGDVAQTLGPRAIQQAGNKTGAAIAGTAGKEELDEFGLPSTINVATDPLPSTAAATAAKAAVSSSTQEDADRLLAAKLGEQTAKEGAVVGEEASVPGLGDVLALGTALYGAIRGGVEAGKASKAVKDYVAPLAPRVAMDNAISFDSSFR